MTSFKVGSSLPTLWRNIGNLALKMPLENKINNALMILNKSIPLEGKQYLNFSQILTAKNVYFNTFVEYIILKQMQSLI